MGKVTIASKNDPPAPTPYRLSAFDKLVSFFSPEMGVRRMAARIQEASASKLAASLGYVAGRSDRKSLQEWNPTPAAPNDEFLFQANTIRGRSRDLVKNSPIASGASNTSTTNVVGRGLRLQSQVDSEYLGISAEQAEVKQRELERIWKLVKDSLDFEGDVTMMDLQAMCFRGTFESGDILAVRRRDLRPGNVIPLKVQLVEADRIQNPQEAMDTEKISGGVEVDGKGVTTAYHVADRHPGQIFIEAKATKWQRIPKVGRGGLHLSRLIFDKRRPGQRRGVPALAPVIEPIKQITRLGDYELAASVVSTLLTVFVKSEQPFDGGGGLPTAPEGTPAGEVPTREGDIFLNPGGVIDLLPGEDIITVNPNRPNGAYDPFFRSIVQQIGMALEIPYEVLMHLYQSSYSASRAALLDAWRFFRGRRKWLSDNFLNLIWEWVLVDAILAGLIDLPGFLTDPQAKAAWMNCTWIGDAPGAINEQDAVKAATLRVAGGFSDLAWETAEMTGRDWNSDVQPNRAAEKKRMEDDGMPYPGDKPEPDEPEDPDAGNSSRTRQEDAA